MGYKSRGKYMFFDKRVRSSMSRTVITDIQIISLAWETQNKNNNNDEG